MKLFFTVIALVLFVSTVNASETVKGVKKDYQSFKEEMNTQLEQAQQNLEVLKTKSQDQISSAGQATVDELQATKDKLKSQVESLKAESIKASKKVKNDLATSISSLNERIQKALKE